MNEFFHRLKWGFANKLLETPNWLSAILISFYSMMNPKRENILVIPVGDFCLVLKDGLKWKIPSPTYAHLLSEREQPYTRYFQVKPNDIVFDVGGGVGRTAVQFAQKIGKKGAIVVIEPNPECLSSLKENIAEIGEKSDFLIIPKAAWCFKGVLSLKLSKNSIKVQTDTLDNIFSELGLGKIDFMKIDVDGAELEVLDGAKRALSKTEKVVLETHLLKNGTTTTDSVGSFLQKEGFKVITYCRYVFAWRIQSSV